MKKYRLIKNYPGCSWTLNSICSNDFIWDNGKKVYLKNYPEFWEEVIEKDYKILSFKHKVSNHIWKNDSQLKDTFCIVDGKAPFTSLEEINRYPKVYEIHSIKRLSDGKIFTVGDIIKHNNNVAYPIGELTKITIVSDTLFFESNHNHHEFNTNMCFISKVQQPLFITKDGIQIFKGDECWAIDKTDLDHLGKVDFRNNHPYDYALYFSNEKKAQQYIKENKPLFTTEDGVDIFEGDKVYGVEVINNFKLLIIENCIMKTTHNPKHCIYLSTKEKAEEYILMNNPCLSINDVLSVSYPSIRNRVITVRKLQKLINSKL
jgi:hypothetical protein